MAKYRVRVEVNRMYITLEVESERKSGAKAKALAHLGKVQQCGIRSLSDVKVLSARVDKSDLSVADVSEL